VVIYIILPDYLRATMSGHLKDLVSQLRGSDARKARILAALTISNIVNEDDLRDIIRGNTKAEVTSLFKEELKLSTLDASALAGLLVPGKRKE
jgi:hypothetical protein